PTSLKIGSAIAGPARWFLNFEGSFECTETEAGTDVVHREVFDFKPPWQWFLDPLLRKWLENDITAEMARFKDLVEGGPTPGP
ncbi:MAG: SRPBCC family protein, partial [Acidimicrobiales bacterium]